ncbi:hypothetical protein [Fulvimarina sp. MAC3]|uniref:hypothetical protein n=1 Tax=Fulvimarina sp. MAC3 TaxID=3148887 RepID=UPI0031FBE3A4
MFLSAPRHKRDEKPRQTGLSGAGSRSFDEEGSEIGEERGGSVLRCIQSHQPLFGLSEFALSAMRVCERRPAISTAPDLVRRGQQDIIDPSIEAVILIFAGFRRDDENPANAADKECGPTGRAARATAAGHVDDGLLRRPVHYPILLIIVQKISQS